MTQSQSSPTEALKTSAQQPSLQLLLPPITTGVSGQNDAIPAKPPSKFVPSQCSCKSALSDRLLQVYLGALAGRPCAAEFAFPAAGLAAGRAADQVAAGQHQRRRGHPATAHARQQLPVEILGQCRAPSDRLSLLLSVTADGSNLLFPVFDLPLPFQYSQNGANFLPVDGWYRCWSDLIDGQCKGKHPTN